MRTVTLLMLLLAIGTSDVRGDPVTAVTAEKLRELPVENLQQAIAAKAGVVASGGELHFRCSPCRIVMIAAEAEPASPSSTGSAASSQALAAKPVGTALGAVVAILDAFERRSYADYTAWLAPDYLFQSTHSTLRARHPRGMSLDDECAFARALFHDPAAESPDSLPYAVRIRLTRRLMRAVEQPGASTAWIIIEGLRAQIDLSDGSEFDTGEARHELQLVKTAEGWRVRRWNELGEGAEPTAEAPVAAAQAADSMAAAATSMSLPARLDIYATMRPGGGVPMLSLALPRRGGRLEMFDIQGRRWFERDLGDLPAGYHRVSLDGGPYPSGVYWARVRQESESATTKVVWAR